MGEIVYVLIGIDADHQAVDVKGVFYSKESAEECIMDYLDKEKTDGLMHYDGWEISEHAIGEKYFHYFDLVVYCYDECGKEIK